MEQQQDAAVKPVQLGGVDVCFPHQPYGVQKVFMSQVVRAIDHEENALLEAPTGCGKTLSLLCGALAWQTAAKAKKAAAEQAAAAQAAAAAKQVFDVIEDTQQEATTSTAAASDKPASGGSDAAGAPEEPVVVPKIYYATRTHSQIAQVVRELKRTVYKPKMAVLGARPHYCINAAVIRKGNIDAECEELLKDGMGCKYKKNANSIGHGTVKVHDIEDLARIGKRHTACPYFVARHLADSAELIFCPYSYLLDPNIRRSTRINASDAVLIFDEAHNIEDQAREAGTMEVELEMLKGSVMALVVAANTSAEGETYRELSEALLRVINWILALADGNAAGAPGQGFKQAGFESFERIWTGQQMLSALTDAGLGPQEVEHLWACYEKAKAAEEKAGFNTEGEAALEPVPAEVKTPRAGGNALGCVASILSVLRLMYGTYTEAPSVPPAGAAAAAGGAGSGGGGGAGSSAAAEAAGGPAVKVVQSVPGVDHVADYRLAVQMWLPRDTNHNNRGRRDRRRPDPSTDGFAETTGCAATTAWAFRFCLWCLNPAVVFRSLSSIARSVLLTSGTLSPLDSFSGELGLDFHVKLEAPHVVDINRQVFSRVVSQGLEGRKLRATYKEADQLDYQDSLGQLLLATASTVPDGMLLFLPSYALMEKLSKRWQDTGLMAQLQRVKAVFSEPRRAGDDFDTTIRRYYEAIDEGQGGLFMAVCRGKVSEGIDFVDGRARCVMVVGIPYPHAKDSKVALKKDYNNATAAASARAQHQGAMRQGVYGGGGGAGSSRGAPPRLLTGDAWYSQQAFRALNQAIGRCIRHRLDYGAILLVDERFKEPRNQTSLSKWVRGTIKPAVSTQALLQDLGTFFQGLTAHPPGTAAPALPPAPLNHQQQQQGQQQQQLVKPGYEPVLGCAGPGPCKPGFEAAPGMGQAWGQGGPGAAKPGFESGPGVAGGCAGGGCGQPCGGAAAAAGSKPGAEAPYAAARGGGGGGAGSDARSKWQQQQMLPAGKQPWQPQKPPPPPQQQQQQQQPQRGQLQQRQQPQQRKQGPMDAFLVKAAAHKQQHQQQQHQHQQVPAAPWQQQQQRGVQPVGIKQEGTPGMWPPADRQQQQHTQQQQQQHQAVSCLAALQGSAQQPTPGKLAAHQQPWQQQQQQGQGLPQQQWQQQQPLRPLDCNVPSTPAGSSSGKAAPHTCDGSSERTPGAGITPAPGTGGKHQAAAAAAAPGVVPDTPQHAPAAVANTPQPPCGPGAAAAAAAGAAAGTAGCSTAGVVTPPAGQHARPSEGVGKEVEGAAGAGVLAAPAGSAAGAVGGCEGVGAEGMQAAASSLGLSLPLVQQWLAGDVASMVRCLQHQTRAAAAAPGMQLQELAVFGIMASFDKALEACAQQQQQQQPGSDAASSLATFWQQWHSYVPTGLLVAAAAAGQQVPGPVVAQADRGQWQGPWLQTMRQQGLRHTLAAMAGLYDQVLESEQQQQQQQDARSSYSAAGPPGYAHPQQHQQQQQWWPQQQQQQQQQQQYQQPGSSGWPQPSWQGMQGPPSSRPPAGRSLPASLQPQPHLQQGPPGQHLAASSTSAVLSNSGCGPPGMQNPGANAPMRFVGRANKGLGGAPGPAAGASAGGPGVGGMGQGGAAGGGTGAGGGGQRPPLKLQLSQSAQQPKRAAVMSAKAQLAAQKRSKVATGQPAKPPPLPGAGSDDDDDDDFV